MGFEDIYARKAGNVFLNSTLFLPTSCGKKMIAFEEEAMGVDWCDKVDQGKII